MLNSIYSDQHYFEPFLNLQAASSSKIVIRSMDLWRYRDTFLVRCQSEDGAVGAAMTNSRCKVLYPLFKELVAPAFIGRDARDLEQLVKDVYTFRNNYKYQGTTFWNCVAYAEASVFDLLGQVAGQSVSQLVGGPWRTQIPVYLSSMRRDTTPEEEVAWIGQRLEQTGAKAVKMKIGGRMQNNADSLPGRTERLIELARTTWGPEITLYMDANGSYDHTRAIEIGRLMEEYDYAWLEEPCPFEQYEETKQVADALDMDVAGTSVHFFTLKVQVW